MRSSRGHLSITVHILSQSSSSCTQSSTLTPSGGNFTVFGDVLVNVLQPGNSNDKQLAFILGSVSEMLFKTIMK